MYIITNITHSTIKDTAHTHLSDFEFKHSQIKTLSYK